MPSVVLTDREMVRMLIADTDLVDGTVVWQDYEVDAAITRYGNIELAAAWLLEGAATDAAKLAIISKTDTTNTDLTEISERLADRAKQIRSLAIVPAAVAPYDAPFSMDSSSGAVLGTMGGMNW